jgi:hydroxymethylpyrimidine/phosphomethylpyrimidine kinase
MMDPVQERSEVMDRLGRAIVLLEGSMDHRLIPPDGVSIGYAIRGARDSGGVAAVSGGIVDEDGKPHAAGPCAFGADEQIARIVLTAMKFDPLVRSAATLRFSENTLAALGGMFLECASFDPAHGPHGLSTMDWGVASCCKDEVPDVIYDRGMNQKVALIRILGEDPVDVANNILILSNRVLHSGL